jgi:hypothetical protein
MKHKTRILLVPGILFLVAGIFFSRMAFNAPRDNVNHAEIMRTSGQTRQSAPSPVRSFAGNEPREEAVAEPGDIPLATGKRVPAMITATPEVRFDVRSLAKIQPGSEAGVELRSERRELSDSIPDHFRGDSSPPLESLGFPLFDGRFVHLQALRHQSTGIDQGVVFAKAEGEPEGGHVLLSYVGTALAGVIHLPSRGEFYEIRTAPDGRSHILTQLDPTKMGACGACPRH